MKDFLYEEAKIKKGIQDPVEAFDKTTCPLHQKNGFDCRLFLLHYVNTFMTHPKKYAMVTRVSQDESVSLWTLYDIAYTRTKANITLRRSKNYGGVMKYRVCEKN